MSTKNKVQKTMQHMGTKSDPFDKKYVTFTGKPNTGKMNEPDDLYVPNKKR